MKIVHKGGCRSLVKKSLHYLRYHVLIDASKEFSVRTALRYWVNSLRYTAPAFPFKIITVDPKEVEYFYPDISHRMGLGQILHEDKKGLGQCRPLRKHWIHNGLFERFVDGLAWEDTVYYRTVVKRFQQHDEFWGYQSIQDFKTKRLQYIDDLYDRIRTEGYRPNYESGHRIPSEDKRADELSYRDALEPLIVIGKDGEMSWRNGFHRLTIARILDLDQIPAQVLARHVEWQQFRDEIYTKLSKENDLPQDSRLDHSDLSDILP